VLDDFLLYNELDLVYFLFVLLDRPIYVTFGVLFLLI